MEDTVFISKLNDIARRNQVVLPFLHKGETPSSEFLADWAGFLELCVKEGVLLSDQRWNRITIESNAPHTRFSLEGAEAEAPDPDFRVGLQLLMGMLGNDEEEST